MRKDRRGIEGLPLRLLLVALLISLTLPIMLSFMQNVTTGMAEDKAAEIADEIAVTMEEMSAAGPGNIRFVNVPADLPTNIHLSLGGEGGTADQLCIRWDAAGREGVRYLEGVTILTEGERTLSFGPGDTLRLECPSGAWGMVLVIRA